MSEPLGVTLIAGYLGAGKTTVVNSLLRHAGGQRLAVLVNEFGALPIDEDLIEAQDDDLISIAGGCICCSFGSDLTAALMALADLKPRPDHVIIEASGVALPGAVASSVSLLDDFQLEGICVLVDAAQVTRQLADDYIGDTIERQLNDADLIVMTKTDLVTAGERDALEQDFATRFGAKPVVQAVKGGVPPDVILGHFERKQTISTGRHDDAAYDSCVIAPVDPVDAAKMAQAMVEGGFGIIRAKGYVTDKSGRVALIQIVGRTCNVTYPTAGVPSGVVCIGLRHNFQPDALRERFSAGELDYRSTHDAR